MGRKMRKCWTPPKACYRGSGSGSSKSNKSGSHKSGSNKSGSNKSGSCG